MFPFDYDLVIGTAYNIENPWLLWFLALSISTFLIETECSLKVGIMLSRSTPLVYGLKLPQKVKRHTLHRCKINRGDTRLGCRIGMIPHE